MIRSASLFIAVMSAPPVVSASDVVPRDAAAFPVLERHRTPELKVMSFYRAVLLLVLACSLARVPARAADSALIEAARKEGRVLWYTTLIVNQAIRPLKDAFEKQYPGIELQYARADEAPTAAKLLAEAQAGRVQADLFDGISNMVPLKRAGIVAPFVPASAALIPPDLKDKDGHWIAILL